MTFCCRPAARWRLLSLRGLRVNLPDSHAGGSPKPMPRAGVPPVRAGSHPLTGHTLAHARRQHSDTTASAEVQLKRLDGEDAGIVEVLMCRHKVRNALGHVFVAQMRETMSTLSHDSAVRVVIFRSLVPGVFCAGADLKERARMNNAESDLFVHSLRSLMTQIASLPTPTIAALDGVALGGGLELALACDLRTAAFSAQMGLIETTRGLLPGAGGSQRLPRAVGMSLAKELIFTGKRVGGQAALEMGLVNRATEQNQTGDAAYREALSLAREIVPQASVVPYFFHSSTDACSRLDHSGSQVEN
ncbi:enoyl-CoA hydratase domain-containing protein 2, mitochondrial isoform X2 [Lampris incognitus]|uniref:enoyl-CoA hydratase domain-containing protein 2, mitochondrial isoform X2 n=1 Tax=Lampris incognitus TaxID=2546036 RepID=UPI0024B4D049|nr:enoyl-CoA hydratase domain-containing protein 2, mitochondrial isoform X2 [Lampris incognitus]